MVATRLGSHGRSPVRGIRNPAHDFRGKDNAPEAQNARRSPRGLTQRSVLGLADISSPRSARSACIMLTDEIVSKFVNVCLTWALQGLTAVLRSTSA